MSTFRFVVFGVFLSVLLCVALPAQVGNAQPEFAKWGELAANETQNEYPDYELIDYSYEGKVAISDERDQFTFKMAIEKNGEKQLINVYVLANPKTGKPIDVFFDDMQQ